MKICFFYSFQLLYAYVIIESRKKKKGKKEISEKKTQVKSLDTKPYVFCAFHF